MNAWQAILMGPVCARYAEEGGQHVAYQHKCLCPFHRAKFEALLRNPQAPRFAITCWLNLLRRSSE